MKLISSKPVGKRRVYDIEVDQVHNFFANGINVHNCATAGGLSTITNAGTVVNSTATTSVVGVNFDGKLLKAVRSDGIVAFYDDAASIGVAPSTTLSASTTPALRGTSSKVSNRASSSSTGITIHKRNPAVQANSMVAYITEAFNTGHMIGDIRGAYLADTVAETITSTELVTNGTFATDTTGWTPYNAQATLSVVAGALRVAIASSTSADGYTSFPTVVGKTYSVSVQIIGFVSAPSGSKFLIGNAGGSGILYTMSAVTSTGVFSANFVATTTTTFLTLEIAGAVGASTDFDNISVKLAEPDRSVKNNGLIVNGSLSKTAVASGANLVSYSGFSAANYLEQPYNSQLDFGTGNFSVMGWVKKEAANSSTTFILSKSPPASIVTPYFDLQITGPGYPTFTGNNGTSKVTGTSATNDGQFHFVCFAKASSVGYLYVDGVLQAQAANTDNYSHSNTDTLRFGYRQDGYLTGTALPTVALWRISATAPSADQIAHIYRTELPLFQANAQCTIAGTSPAVTALAFDSDTEILHVGTSYGRSGFKGLLRVDSEATTTGTLTSLSAQGGTILTGGTSGKVYVPAKLLRDELARKDQAAKALGKVPVFFDFTATASQTAFVLPKGYTAKGLYKNGTLMRETTTGVYWTRSNDGFAETCTLSVGATVSDWISIMAVRS